MQLQRKIAYDKTKECCLQNKNKKKQQQQKRKNEKKHENVKKKRKSWRQSLKQKACLLKHTYTHPDTHSLTQTVNSLWVIDLAIDMHTRYKLHCHLSPKP